MSMGGGYVAGREKGKGSYERFLFVKKKPNTFLSGQEHSNTVANSLGAWCQLHLNNWNWPGADGRLKK
jgi:hypothetical protein